MTAEELKKGIAFITSPCSTGQTKHTAFSIATGNLLAFEEELKKYGARVSNAVKENNGRWLLSVDKGM